MIKIDLATIFKSFYLHETSPKSPKKENIANETGDLMLVQKVLHELKMGH